MSRWRSIIALALVSGLLIPASAAAGEPGGILRGRPGPPIPAALFGVNTAFPEQARQSVPLAWVRLWDAGVSWAQVEPARGTFDWTRLDGLMAQADAAGVRVMYVLGDTPRWAADRPNLPPRNIEDLRDFVRALVSRYGARLDAIQAWNEANLITYFSGAPQDVADFTKTIYDVVRAKGLPTKVIAASMTTRSDSAYSRYVRSDYLVALARRGWPVDAFAVHSYPRANGTPADRVAGIREFQALLTRSGAPNLPVMETEINYGLAGLGQPHRVVDGAAAQGFIAQTYVDTVRLGLESAFWYAWTAKPHSVLGVQLDPAANDNIAAWKWAHDTLVGSQLIRCDVEQSVVSCGFERAGARFVVAYVSGDGAAPFIVPPGITQACSMGRPCAPVDASTITVTSVPTLLT